MWSLILIAYFRGWLCLLWRRNWTIFITQCCLCWVWVNVAGMQAPPPRFTVTWQSCWCSMPSKWVFCRDNARCIKNLGQYIVFLWKRAIKGIFRVLQYVARYCSMYIHNGLLAVCSKVLIQIVHIAVLCQHFQFSRGHSCSSYAASCLLTGAVW